MRHRALPTNGHDTFGVLVRLLADIPRYGAKGTVLRVRGGTMRNHWYPKRMAEYVTPAALRAMGLNPYGGGEGIKSERDVGFVPRPKAAPVQEGRERDAAAAARAAADATARERRARAELAKSVVEVRELPCPFPVRIMITSGANC